MKISCIIGITILSILSTASCKPQNQDVKTVYSKYLLKQSKLNLIQYRVNRIDTLPNGDVWNTKGTATMLRNTKDSVYKFSYYGKRDDIERENIFVENKHFQIYPKTKTYRIENNYGRHTLGAPGGQMVIEDFFNQDTINTIVTLKSKENDSFEIKREKRLRSTVIIKYLIVDKSTLLPTYIWEKVSDSLLNYYSSSTFNISEILIGDQVLDNKLENLQFLATYSEDYPLIDKTADVMIGHSMPDLSIKTYSNKILNLKNLDSKVVLLDFWELWCGSCIQSLPKINHFSQSIDSKFFIVIGITRSNIENVKKYLSSNDINFIQAQGNDELYNYFKVNTYPRYVLIDKKSIVRYIFYEYSKEIEIKVKSLI